MNDFHDPHQKNGDKLNQNCNGNITAEMQKKNILSLWFISRVEHNSSQFCESKYLGNYFQSFEPSLLKIVVPIIV